MRPSHTTRAQNDCHLSPAAKMAKSLLDLPRELRDIIYGYTLTEEDGLLVQEWLTMHPKAAGAKYGTDANQLKFICRQLYTETTGLGLRYNKVTFGGSCGFEAFEGFIGVDCTPAHFGRVKSIVILLESSDKLLQDVIAADALGKAYPALSFEMRCAWLTERTDANIWCWGGCSFQYLTRGTFPDLAAVGFKTMVRQNSGTLDGFGSDSRNVEIFPASFDEEELRSGAIDGYITDVNGWVAQFKKWFEEGF
ncbi:hypothetical protein BKA58DRAFT_443343 [Alternaria rosae]|uniref:uncharacterized protein n=1 Tax=Alternaria rosae TaxID=1187941 RepID=UPI001E8E44FC|nr:uncharacterized protein BKA58DRAFT_443343 [Alternaria rosae]KAH6865291.1 hypothetical protein BKA58DRAFT_443343 [Alternaria rosae]